MWFTPSEEEALCTFLALSPEQFRRSYTVTRERRPSLRERWNGDCVFFDASRGRCAVYHVRPLQCRLFPFWPSLLAHPDNWADETRRCPGMDSGRFHAATLIREHLALAPFPDL